MESAWTIRGQMVLSCNCDVFCPCVISLGKAHPSQGFCQTWWALHIESGQVGDEKLDGINAAMLMDIPGPLANGGWTVGLYIDEGASPLATEALTQILTGKAGGPTAWFRIVIASFLGTKSVPISFESADEGWKVQVPKIIDGNIEPVAGPKGGPTRVTNAAYWVAPDIVVCTGTRSRFRDWGRNWDLSGKSAEYARIDWKGP